MTLKFDRSYRKEFPSSARKSTASEGNYLRTKEQDNRYLDAVVCDENNETAAFLADRDHPTRCRSKKSEKAGLPSSSRIPDRNFLSTSCCVTSPVLVATTTEPASVAPTGGKGKSWRDILLQFLWRLTGSFRGVFEGRETGECDVSCLKLCELRSSPGLFHLVWFKIRVNKKNKETILLD
ncbi:unnamed protein product [Clavelina lepadiformis]|uniref:Uncharacterized protein n=1 Tax=Clavelina lepadiformis TaxID=159417 RepID=A0ABP0G8G4_CLALP